jgi:hypothetical protein
MARRILSADAALMPQSQVSLTSPAAVTRAEIRPHLFSELQLRWNGVNAPGAGDTQPGGDAVRLFDWDDRSALMAEIDLMNRAQAVLDEAAVKIAPCLLRIVLTVKAHLADPKEQRAFLGEHLDLDFRRISELCIVAESYGLLDPRRRESGAREIERYGWSNALKLAYVRDARDRQHLWERACAGRPRAGYRDVLEQIQLYRDRKLIAAPGAQAPERKELVKRVGEAKDHVVELAALAPRLRSRMDYEHAIELLESVQKELSSLRRAFQDRLDAEEHASMAGHG